MSDYDTTVARTILVVRDLDAVRPAADVRVQLPRLPALEQWLALGDAHSARGGWRQWLQRELADPALAALPPASIAAAAVPDAPADGPVWLAAPVHFIAGLDTVRLHPAGLLRLDAGEEQALVRDFARVFADSGWSLHATGRGELLLSGAGSGASLGGTVAGEVRSDDPAQWVGADPRDGLPRGPGAAPLRRLGAELEMWLHQHPVNEARAARGQLPVSALWLWGGGADPARAGAARGQQPAVVACGDDLFVDGLARCAGWRLEPAPAAWPTARSPRPARLEIVVAGAVVPPDLRMLESIERDWIAPALAQWRRGARELTLLTAGAAVSLPRSRLRRAWRSLRRPRPWWQALPAC